MADTVGKVKEGCVIMLVPRFRHKRSFICLIWSVSLGAAFYVKNFLPYDDMTVEVSDVKLRDESDALDQEAVSVKENASAIMILTKVRSGSSLTGDILQQDPTSFYIYEPLIAFHNALVEKKYHHLLLNGKRIFIDEAGYYKQAGNIIKSYASCDFHSVDVNTLSHPFISMGIKGRDYVTCLNKTTSMTEDEKLERVRSCIHILKDKCLKSRHRIVKVVRLPMAFAGSLLGSIHSMQILHLVRDPRAIINSMAKTGTDILNDTEHAAKELCSKLENDKLSSDYFKLSYSNRIFRLKYEDLASNPINISAELYRKFGMTFTEIIRNYIMSITLSGKKDGCSICPERSNSTHHVTAWRRDLLPSDINHITRPCFTYLTRLGYIH